MLLRVDDWHSLHGKENRMGNIDQNTARYKRAGQIGQHNWGCKKKIIKV